MFLHCFIGTLDPIRQYPPPIFLAQLPLGAARGKRGVLFFSLLHLWAWWRFGSSLSEKGKKKRKSCLAVCTLGKGFFEREALEMFLLPHYSGKETVGKNPSHYSRENSGCWPLKKRFYLFE